MPRVRVFILRTYYILRSIIYIHCFIPLVTVGAISVTTDYFIGTVLNSKKVIGHLKLKTDSLSYTKQLTKASVDEVVVDWLGG